MTKEELIESGLLEQYVLGITSEEENQVVIDGLNNYPELKQYMAQVQKTMDTIAFQNKIIPPPNLRQATLEKIENSERIASGTHGIMHSWITWLLSGLALVLSVSTYCYYKEFCHARDQRNEIHSTYAALSQDCDRQNQEQAIMKKLIALYEHELYQPVYLHTDDTIPQEIVVFWPNDQKEAYLYCKSMNPVAAGKSYQIWADVDNAMVPLGVFDGENTIIPIKSLKNASSLNVTIEKKGGSEHPDVANLIMSKSV